mmetsp:Transcript_2533/g.7166  ORF Transcript_2533/g.7166 Transcript_2533/m.7166 type:complete len:148 (-) Transcript_2533:966-1409(-)
MLGHSGDVPNETLVALGAPPADEKAQLRVAQRMVAHSQFCSSGDHTLEAAQFAISSAAARNDADERFVFLFSDANLERYGIRPVDLATVLTAEPRVHAHVIFLGDVGGQAERLKKLLPTGTASVCLDPASLPSAFKTAFAKSVLRDA